MVAHSANLIPPYVMHHTHTTSFSTKIICMSKKESPSNPLSHHLLSTLAEELQQICCFHAECTLCDRHVFLL